MHPVESCAACVVAEAAGASGAVAFDAPDPSRAITRVRRQPERMAPDGARRASQVGNLPEHGAHAPRALPCSHGAVDCDRLALDGHAAAGRAGLRVLVEVPDDLAAVAPVLHGPGDLHGLQLRPERQVEADGLALCRLQPEAPRPERIDDVGADAADFAPVAITVDAPPEAHVVLLAPVGHAGGGVHGGGRGIDPHVSGHAQRAVGRADVGTRARRPSADCAPRPTPCSRRSGGWRSRPVSVATVTPSSRLRGA